MCSTGNGWRGSLPARRPSWTLVTSGRVAEELTLPVLGGTVVVVTVPVAFLAASRWTALSSSAVE